MRVASAIVLVLLAVFVPVTFMPGETGRMFAEFSVTLAIAVGFSGFVALTLSPMLSSRLLRHNSNPRGIEHFLGRLVDDAAVDIRLAARVGPEQRAIAQQVDATRDAARVAKDAPHGALIEGIGLVQARDGQAMAHVVRGLALGLQEGVVLLLHHPLLLGDQGQLAGVAGVEGQRAREADPFPHPARELRRSVVPALGQAHVGHQGVRAAVGAPGDAHHRPRGQDADRGRRG